MDTSVIRAMRILEECGTTLDGRIELDREDVLELKQAICSIKYEAPPPVLKALDRLTEYAAGHPNHDTDEIVGEARSAIRLQSIETEDFEKWVDSLWEQFDWIFQDWAKDCRPEECKAEKWKCPGDMQRLDHVQFREAARTVLSRFQYKNSIKHRPLDGREAHHIYATLILSLRDWLVPEEAELEDDGTCDGIDFMEELARYEERQRLRAQLTAEANRAQSYNPEAN